MFLLVVLVSFGLVSGGLFHRKGVLGSIKKEGASG